MIAMTKDPLIAYKLMFIVGVFLIVAAVDKPEYYSLGGTDTHARIVSFHSEAGRSHSGLDCHSCHLSSDTGKGEGTMSEPSLIPPDYFTSGCDEGYHEWRFIGTNGYDDFYRCIYCGKEEEH
jgi:hypothetical protein